MPFPVAALFTDGTGTPATGLVLADIEVSLYSRDKGTGAVILIWNALSPTEEIGGTGIYTRYYSPGDLDLFDYYAFAEYTGAAVLDSNFSLQQTPTVLSPPDVWSSDRRTLTHPLIQLRLAQEGNDIQILRGDTLDVDLIGLGNITGYDNVWFTVKDDKDPLDSASIIQIDSDTGLLVIAGEAAGVAGNGSIVVTDVAAGNLTIILEAVESAKVTLIGRTEYDIQWIDAAGVVATLVIGRILIIGDITRRIT